MQMKISEGKYVVAVSGGVDSVVLLDLLHELPHVELMVAHFDHGIREDSAEDARFVAELAASYNLPFYSIREELGPHASEAVAREARYAFLRRLKDRHGAIAIMTAHHQDDVLETMILNVLRGTGRRGLSPMSAESDIIRPLLDVTKNDLLRYATGKGLAWREDSTNTDLRYKRNAVREEVMKSLGEGRKTLVELHADARRFNDEIDDLLRELSGRMLTDDGALIRSRYVQLPHMVAAAFMHRWLVQREVQDVDSHMVTRATIAARTLPAGKRIDLGGHAWLKSEKTSVKIMSD